MCAVLQRLWLRMFRRRLCLFFLRSLLFRLLRRDRNRVGLRHGRDFRLRGRWSGRRRFSSQHVGRRRSLLRQRNRRGRTHQRGLDGPWGLIIPHSAPRRWPKNARNTTAAITNPCSSSDPAKGAPKGSCSSSIVSLAAIPLLRLLRGPGALSPVLNRLRHNADVRDTGLFHRIHHRCEGTEGDSLISLQINYLMRRIDARFR